MADESDHETRELELDRTRYDGLWGRQIKAETEGRERMKTPTPRPWEWLPKEGQFIVDAKRNIVAEIPCQSGNPADGKLIVTAVNERGALTEEVTRLREALAAYVKFSDDAAKLLDADNEVKCLKLLLAMSGHAPRYRHDVDVAYAALQPKAEIGK